MGHESVLEKTQLEPSATSAMMNRRMSLGSISDQSIVIHLGNANIAPAAAQRRQPSSGAPVGIVIRQRCEGQCREGDVSNGCARQRDAPNLRKKPPECGEPQNQVGKTDGKHRMHVLFEMPYLTPCKKKNQRIFRKLYLFYPHPLRGS